MHGFRWIPLYVPLAFAAFQLYPFDVRNHQHEPNFFFSVLYTILGKFLSLWVILKVIKELLSSKNMHFECLLRRIFSNCQQERRKVTGERLQMGITVNINLTN